MSKEKVTTNESCKVDEETLRLNIAQLHIILVYKTHFFHFLFLSLHLLKQGCVSIGNQVSEM